MQSYDGEVTEYTYESGSNPATANALTSITNPDGTSQTFTYNASGQLTGTSQTGGAEPVTYSYNLGEVTVTDAAGDASQYYFDENGNLVKTVDPLGNVTFATYDSNGNLTSLTGPTGLTTTYTYDANGNLTSSTDALGQTTSYTYTSSDNLLASVTNAQGDTTNYNYDSNGDLTSTEYPDDTVETATYDALGDPLVAHEPGRRGHQLHVQRGRAGRQRDAGRRVNDDLHLRRPGQPDQDDRLVGRHDAHLQFGGRAHQHRLSDGPVPRVHLQRRRPAHPDGRDVGLDGHGDGQLHLQHARSVDQADRRHGANIIQYTYNNLGELTREEMGDGTYTTYTYDADGNVLDLVNYAANGTVDSSFVYTYNALDEETSMATIDGTWTYSYDNDGELVTASFASTDSAIPEQSLTYVYNAAGDRTQTIVNGVTTNYTSNSVNEYTTVGGTTYEYDADGNLISMTDASGTTTYTYNSLNQLTGVTSPTGSWSTSTMRSGTLSPRPRTARRPTTWSTRPGWGTWSGSTRHRGA